MKYKIDILILYAEADDHELEQNETGWVGNFKKFLDMLLKQVLGESLNILLKSDKDNITASNLNDVAVLLPVISRKFNESGKMLDILEEFTALDSKSNVNQIFKVLKNFLPREEQPPKVRDLIAYELYHYDTDTLETKEFNNFFDKEAEHDYWMKMVDLVYDIYESLIVLQNRTDSAKVKSLFSRKTIYLAETGHDLVIQRNIIKRELLRHGYKILPDHALPGELHALSKNIKKELDEADMSIHLIGNSYGEIPDGADKSVVDLQNQLAVEKSKEDQSFVRMVWLPTDTSKASERQRSFIENLKRDSDFSNSAGLLQTPLEDFKSILREELMITGTKKKLNLLSMEELANGNPSVYVLYDLSDEKNVEPLIDLVKKEGYQVLKPKFKGELLDLRQWHINNLQRFDAAIVYQGNVNDQWVRMKLLDLLKAPGFGRNKPVKGRAVVSDKDTTFIDDLTKDVTIISKASKDKLGSVKEFLKVFE